MEAIVPDVGTNSTNLIYNLMYDYDSYVNFSPNGSVTELQVSINNSEYLLHHTPSLNLLILLGCFFFSNFCDSNRLIHISKSVQI